MLLLVYLAGPAHAQTITDVRIGFPAGEGRRCRVGAWTPIYVDVRAGEETGDFELVVETADGDDVENRYVTPVPTAGAGQSQTVITYYKPGNRTGGVKAFLRKKGGAAVHEYPEQRPEFGELLDPEEVLYLTAGTRLPGLRDALAPPRQDEPSEADIARARRGIAFIEHADLLPDRWYGYDGVDVLILTASGDTLGELVQRSRKGGPDTPAAALGEWVRRGGRLVLAASDPQRAGDLLTLMRIDDFELGAARPYDNLPEIGRWTDHLKDPFPGVASIDVARLAVKSGAAVLVRHDEAGEPVPLLALAPCGRGRVLLAAFDLGSPALAGWNGQEAFWRRMHQIMGPRLAVRGSDSAPSTGAGVEELATSLQRGLEDFDTSLPFGWVALFIALYILVVGPLDYFFLKKVVKRPELTWVTFPLLVLAVSVAAYYSAYAVTGSRQRVHKIDVVDIDLRGGDVYGTTWFSLLSSEVHGYTLGLRPAPEWGGVDGSADGAVVMSKLSPPDASIGGLERPGSGSLFRRPYEYAAGAAGLKGVPLPARASRSFVASWRARVETGKLIEARDFGISPARGVLSGRIVNHLPAELRDVSLFYRGRWYKLGTIGAGSPFRIDALNVESATAPGGNVGQWMREPFGEAASGALDPAALMKSVLFHTHEGDPNSDRDNSTLRALDQGWRLKPLPALRERGEATYLDEAILVGRVVLPAAPADEVARHGASATRLWLGRLPGDGDRPALEGSLRQETYVRVFIPVPR